MPDDPRITDYEAFWLFYLREHAAPLTRALHYGGTFAVIAGIAAAILTGKVWLLIAVPLAGYGPAWFAHFFIEKNRPATFRYPAWSLISDFRMTFAWVSGQIDVELARAGVGVKSEITHQR